MKISWWFAVILGRTLSYARRGSGNRGKESSGRGCVQREGVLASNIKILSHYCTSNGEDDPTNPGGSSVRLESHILYDIQALGKL
ncbi:hypothetical protein EAF00_000022 [Botryotinia globosa]|nr:hypothetical protein EAF00_000022 [Botryotinia globosa]